MVKNIIKTKKKGHIFQIAPLLNEVVVIDAAEMCRIYDYDFKKMKTAIRGVGKWIMDNIDTPVDRYFIRIDSNQYYLSIDGLKLLSTCISEAEIPWPELLHVLNSMNDFKKENYKAIFGSIYLN